MKIEKQRSLAQNRSLHKFCTELADEANNHGISMKAVIQDLQVDWSMEGVKSIIHAISKAKYQKTSTADLTTKELSDCCKEVQKIFLEQGIHVEFPSFEENEFIKHYTK
jgi:tRNA A37 threonylcarbamoyltransferase TsaD